MKSRNIAKGYMQVPGVDNTDLFLTVTTDTSMKILIGLNSFHEEEEVIDNLFGVESVFLYTNM